jgi:hypothetical protein
MKKPGIGNAASACRPQERPSPASDAGQLRPIEPLFVTSCDDEMMFRVDHDLHVVADHAGAAPLGPSSAC